MGGDVPAASTPRTWPGCRPAGLPTPSSCWELSNLLAEWDRVYGDPDNRTLPEALWFHDRWLPGFLGRCEKWFRCD